MFEALPAIILLALVALVGWLVLKLTFSVLKWLAINTLSGLIVLGLLNFLGITHVQLNVINLLIVALGGIPGAFIVILLSLL
ncbi:MAG: pro-sigmaK processing inhibitor BofA family protein [Thermococcus sp.]|nr:pro-sigmaK processing inhibitor BofA family protein [Thermococcus sp.]